MANTPIVSDSNNASYDGNLSTANGFYAAEAWNLGAYSTTTLAVSTARYISVTFAHAGNCQGIVLGCYATSSTTNAYGMKVTLQEYSGGSWVDRAVKELTAAEIHPEYILGSAIGTSGLMSFFSFVPFKFATPYAVTTASSTWRFKVENGTSAGSTTVWQLSTSDATNPSFVTWCDNTATATDGDILIVADKVTIDKSFTTGAALGTGDTAVGVAGWICRSTDISKTGVCLLEWQNPPTSSYTFTIGGSIMMGYFAGMRVGSSANPIPNAQQAIITRTASPVAGTTTNGFLQALGTTSSRSRGKCSLFFYGEIPVRPYAILDSDAAISQAKFTTTETISSQWAAGDYVFVGKQNIAGQGTTVWQQIQSISDTEDDKSIVTLTSNLLSYTRIAGAYILNRDRGWGIKLLGYSNAAYLYIAAEQPQYFEMSGCLVYDTRFTLLITSSYYNYPLLPANRSQQFAQDNMFVSTSTTQYHGISALLVPPEGFIFQRNYAFRTCGIYAITAYYAKLFMALPFSSGLLEVYNNVGVANYSGQWNYSSASNIKNKFIGNVFQNASASTPFAVVHGLQPEIKNNYFWGSGSTVGLLGALEYYSSIGADISGNHFDKCVCGIATYSQGVTMKAKQENEVFGSEAANTSDIGFIPFGYFDITLINPSETITWDPLNDLSSGITISKLAIVNEGGVANTDSLYTPLGTFRRCGDGLADTTTRIGGDDNFSLRFNPSASDALTWSFDVPTGNIQNKNMTVSVWFKINSANYYSGTYIMPRLTVDYDNGTEVYASATATTDWQLVVVSFTPTTTYGQITVSLSGTSDATEPDNYFYADDMSVFYPPGVTINLGGFDLWANAMPITPPIATSVNANDIWNVQTSTLTTPGTTGKKLNDNLTFIQSQY